MKNFLDSVKGKLLKSYLRAVLAAGVAYALANLTSLDPKLAVVVGAFAGPLAKWADKAEKDFGLGSK